MNYGFTCDPLEIQEDVTAFEREMILYAKNSVVVEIDLTLPNVTIINKCCPENEWFMQEEEAQSFLDKAETIWNEKKITDMDAVYLTAYEYADAI